MATPKEQHQARHGRVTATDWERRREQELARDRTLGLDPHALDDQDVAESAAGVVDAGESAPTGVDPVTTRSAEPPML